MCSTKPSSTGWLWCLHQGYGQRFRLQIFSSIWGEWLKSCLPSVVNRAWAPAGTCWPLPPALWAVLAMWLLNKQGGDWAPRCLVCWFRDRISTFSRSGLGWHKWRKGEAGTAVDKHGYRRSHSWNQRRWRMWGKAGWGGRSKTAFSFRGLSVCSLCHSGHHQGGQSGPLCLLGI